MEYIKFKITNYKGIENVVIDFDKSPRSNIYTLVGLNESGKTTVLEAINFFNYKNKDTLDHELSKYLIVDPTFLIPVNKRHNFNGDIVVEATLKLDQEDINNINKYIIENTIFKSVYFHDNQIKYWLKFSYKNSQFLNWDPYWDGFHALPKKSKSNDYVYVGNNNFSEENQKLYLYCDKLIPSILYFPNFLFDFPEKINIDEKEIRTPDGKYFYSLIQDIFFSIDEDKDASVKTHILDRIKSKDPNDKRSLDDTLHKMSNKVNQVVFGSWKKIFKKTIDALVSIQYDEKDKTGIFLKFDIRADGIYQISQRSLGFRWFFVFLLFTQFRVSRLNAPKNIIYLFDEPASNLHPYAQKQLLKSFENLSKGGKVIYATHSHHLINPQWLESTYIVKNGGMIIDDTENFTTNKTDISIELYRDFVNNHPKDIDYFQPILDVLEYSPSNLENIPNCIFVEGKNDFYSLEYFSKVIFNSKYKLNITPGFSANSLKTLISLYLGWGKDFIILLDSDKEGMKQKSRYIEEFGSILENRIHTYNDIDSLWVNYGSEKLFHEDDLLNFLTSIYSNTSEFNKVHFNRAIQEYLINGIKYKFNVITTSNFYKVLDFLQEKIQSGVSL